MTLVVIGPVTNDLVIIGDKKSQKIGGATYFQSFVFEKYFSDYLVVANCYDESLAGEFPSSDKVRILQKDNTHFFINRYPFPNNMDVREQSSNFADIPILKRDLEDILPEDIDGFVLNPLNRHDFPVETIEYLKGFGVPIFLSLQGFLRLPGDELNGNNAIVLDNFDGLDAILKGVGTIFLDEAESNIIGTEYDVDEMVITDGSRGSRVQSQHGNLKIDAVQCENVVDTTGCGDTYMAAYISSKLKGKSSNEAGNFASLIASEKLKYFGPYNYKK